MAIEFDEILHHLGDFGFYQKLVYSLMCLCMIPTSFTQLGPAFIGANVPHVCKTTDDLVKNVTNVKDIRSPIPHELRDGVCRPNQCRRFADDFDFGGNISMALYQDNASCLTELPTLDCDLGWSFDIKNHRTSVVTEWDLVCDRSWLRELARSAAYVGVLVGTVLLSPLSDRYGRKPSIFASVLFQFIFSVCSALSPTLESFVLFQFLYGCTFFGVYVVTFSYTLEWIGCSKRAFVSNTIVVFYALAYMSQGGLAYLVRNWRHLILAMCLPGLFILPYFWIVPESPRWLLSRGDVTEAEVIILKAARINKKDISYLMKNLVTMKWDAERNIARSNIRRNHSIIDLVRTPVLRKRGFKMFCIWMTSSVSYFGVSLNMSSLQGDTYVNFFLGGAVEIPGVLLAVYLLDKYGRIVPLCCFCVVAGVGCIASQFFPQDLWYAALSIAVIGKLAVAAAFWTIVTHSPNFYQLLSGRQDSVRLVASEGSVQL
ncbi:organic cation transporter protein-like [Ptychodera flava]|uniref:organic cation transporter protein-like n=1 Tax=Ptychodera flava TaxID=63121 RepID=UPI00396A34A1